MIELKPGDKVILKENIYFSEPVIGSLAGDIKEIKEVGVNLTFTDGSVGLQSDYIRPEDALHILTRVANHIKERILCLMKITYVPAYTQPELPHD